MIELALKPITQMSKNGTRVDMIDLLWVPLSVAAVFSRRLFRGYNLNRTSHIGPVALVRVRLDRRIGGDRGSILSAVISSLPSLHTTPKVPTYHQG